MGLGQIRSRSLAEEGGRFDGAANLRRAPILMPTRDRTYGVPAKSPKNGSVPWGTETAPCRPGIALKAYPQSRQKNGSVLWGAETVPLAHRSALIAHRLRSGCAPKAYLQFLFGNRERYRLAWSDDWFSLRFIYIFILNVKICCQIIFAIFVISATVKRQKRATWLIRETLVFFLSLKIDLKFVFK